jgi:hypothetical protein
MKSPPKETGAVLHAHIKRIPSGDYHWPPTMQATSYRWQREAVRLFSEYWRTNDPKHLAAFVVHVVAMRAYTERATQ